MAWQPETLPRDLFDDRDLLARQAEQTVDPLVDLGPPCRDLPGDAAGRWGKPAREPTFGDAYIARRAIGRDGQGPCIQPPEVPKPIQRTYGVRLTVAPIPRRRFRIGRVSFHDQV